MTDLSNIPSQTKPPRRTYSKKFKQMVVTESEQSGVSIAAVALKHGINANLLHKWRIGYGFDGRPKPASKQAFVPIEYTPAAATGVSSDRIILRANGLEIEWPLIGASQLPAFIAALKP